MSKKIDFLKKGIIFDFDDTIANTQPGKKKALKIVASRIHNHLKKKGGDINLKKLQKVTYTQSRKMDGQGIYNRNLWWLAIAKKLFKKKPAKAFLNNLTREYWQTVIKNSTLYSETKSTLNYFKNQGYALGLLTDTDGVRGMKLKRIEALNLKKRFDSIVVAGEDTKEIKPNPKPFYLISKKLNLQPKECIFVGNNLFTDIKGAKKTGMTAVLVERQNNSSQNIRTKVKPDKVIQRLSRVKNLLTLF